MNSTMRRYSAIFGVVVYFLAVINAQETATVSASISVEDENRESHKRSANDKVEPLPSPLPKTISGFKPMIPNSYGYPIDSQYHPTSFHANTFAGKPQPILMIAAASPHQHHYPSPSFIQTPLPSNNFYSSIRNGLPQPQFYHHQQQQHQHQPFPYAMAPNHFAFSPLVATAAMSPIFHNHHPAMLAFQQHNMYHHPAPVNTFYANPQQFHKIPIYNQQPQTIPVASLISSFTSHNLPSSYSPSPANSLKHTPSHHIKSLTLKTPQSTNANISPVPSSFSPSHVEHNEGAVSFAHFSTPTASSTGELKKELVTPQRLLQHQPLNHYNNHPQPILSPAYSKLVQYAPTSNIPLNHHHYSSQNDYANVPSFSYAHLSKALPSSSSNPHHSPGLIIGTSQRASVSSTVSPHQG